MLVTAEIPDDLVPLVAQIFSETFPTLTAGKGPSDAVRSVVLSWVQTTLIQYETERVRRMADAAVAEAEAARDQALAEAVQRAREVAARLDVDSDPEELPGSTVVP